jgi:hypothetical protein
MRSHQGDLTMHTHPGPHASRHKQASLPPIDKIPDTARTDVLAFLALRRRIADAERAARTARAALKDAVQQDRDDLTDHIAGGGSSATFEYPRTTAAKKEIESTTKDLEVLNDLTGRQYVAMVYCLQEGADQGAAIAQQDIDPTATAYLQAIDAAEQARRNYLAAIGLRYFWAHLIERGNALATAGNGDQVVLKRGPITRVDSHTFKALRSDAQAHTRIEGTSEAASIW